jgi:hypothetical protein
LFPIIGDGGATGSDKPFTSARLTTKASWLHGKFEMRARLPKGKNFSPIQYKMRSTKFGRILEYYYELHIFR